MLTLTPIKITITKIPGEYKFKILGVLPDSTEIQGTMDISDLFSHMSMDQYTACVKDHQEVFFMPSYERLKPYIRS